jgi:hypothetical protein
VPGASLGTSHIWIVPTHAEESMVPFVDIETRIDALEV